MPRTGETLRLTFYSKSGLFIRSVDIDESDLEGWAFDPNTEEWRGFLDLFVDYLRPDGMSYWKLMPHEIDRLSGYLSKRFRPETFAN